MSALTAIIRAAESAGIWFPALSDLASGSLDAYEQVKRIAETDSDAAYYAGEALKVIERSCCSLPEVHVSNRHKFCANCYASEATGEKVGTWPEFSG